MTSQLNSSALVRLLLSLAAFAHLVGVAVAGGGPENVFVVVNPRSWASKTIANHFCALRGVPASNVFFLDWKGGSTSTSIDGFREAILQPVFKEIDARQLGGQIDYVVYSSDFPFEIRFGSDLAQPQPHASGSITGLTYLAQFVLAKDSNYAQAVNWYMRMPVPDRRGISLIEGRIGAPTAGFRSSYQWGPSGELLQQGGRQYILSTMLGHTTGRGNSVEETIEYLQRSAMADGSHPRGTVYFMLTPNSRPDPRQPQQYDVRTAVRMPAFAAAMQELRALGVAAETVDAQDLPQDRGDVLGIVTGTRSFDFASCGSRILPGSICENFTSFGGALHGEARQSGQTRLSEFLRYGAAGSSGTVVEPSALWTKFPHPMIHVHYARGCSLGEAFYQSVYSPYQLLIVGDPLCQPWAEIPAVWVEDAPSENSVSGRLRMTPRAQTASGADVSHFELFADGRRVDRCDPGGQFDLDTQALGDGYHELRIVAIESSPIQTQGRLIVPIHVNNHGRQLRCQTRPQAAAAWERPITISASSPGAREIVIVQRRHIVGRIAGQQGQVRVNAQDLGYGPVELQAVGLYGHNPQDHVFGQPIVLQVEPPRPLPAAQRLGGFSRPEPFRVQAAGGRNVPMGQATNKDWLAKAGIELNEPFEILGDVQAPRADVYQFELEFAGTCEIRLNHIRLFRNTTPAYQHYYVPVALAPGNHRVSIRGTLKTTQKFFLAFGNRGTASINSQQFR